MSFIYFVIFWLVGLFVSAFTLVPILIIFFFSIPFTAKLRRIGVVKNGKPVQRNLISVLILGFIFALVIWLVSKYSNSLVAFVFGAGIAVLFSFGKLGENQSNVQDYFKTNEEFLDKEKVDEMYQTIPKQS